MENATEYFHFLWAFVAPPSAPPPCMPPPDAPPFIDTITNRDIIMFVIFCTMLCMCCMHICVIVCGH